MEPKIYTNVKIPALTVEMDAIHFANTSYWMQGHFQTVAARAQYQRRQDRLEEIRTELAQLQRKESIQPSADDREWKRSA